MAKTERIFPLSTIGGRIQNLRREKEISRAKFYELVYGEGLASDDSSKNKTVMNWESGKSQAFTPDILKRMCEVLDCDADYLVGLQAVPRKEYGHIEEMTGLSYDAATRLRDAHNSGNPCIDIISGLLTDDELLMRLTICCAKDYGIVCIMDKETDPFTKKSTDYFITPETIQQSDMMELYRLLINFVSSRRIDKGLSAL